jgi:hypothetical protein
LDCADPLALGEFWAAMLDGEIMFTNTTIVVIRTDWVWLTALKVPDYVAPTWPGGDVPQQIHLDLAVTELEAAVAESSAWEPGSRRSSQRLTDGESSSTRRVTPSVSQHRFRQRPSSARHHPSVAQIARSGARAADRRQRPELQITTG